MCVSVCDLDSHRTYRPFGTRWWNSWRRLVWNSWETSRLLQLTTRPARRSPSVPSSSPVQPLFDNNVASILLPCPSLLLFFLLFTCIETLPYRKWETESGCILPNVFLKKKIEIYILLSPLLASLFYLVLACLHVIHNKRSSFCSFCSLFYQLVNSIDFGRLVNWIITLGSLKSGQEQVSRPTNSIRPSTQITAPLLKEVVKSLDQSGRTANSSTSQLFASNSLLL